VSNVLLGIIGVIFFIGLALAGASYFGSAITGSKVEASATDYLNQSSQIARAIDQYVSDNGTLPIDGTNEPVAILVSKRYMTKAPPGGRSPWVMSASAKALLTPAAGTVEEGLKVCVAARKKANIPSPSNVLKCDGSTGALEKFDPCCLL
jgi:hypothetical protein